MQYIEATLKNLGFSENEAKVYLASLELGVASAQDIGKKADILRTTTYSVLEQLVLRGVIIKTKKKSINRYFAETPENLIRRFSSSVHSLENSLPELKAIQNERVIKPKVVFYEGIEGINKIYEDTIKSKPDEILEFNAAEMFSAMPENFASDYLDVRRKNKIKARRIAPGDSDWEKHAENDKTELSRTIILPRAEFNIPVEINIYNDKIAFMSYTDKMGVVIESRGIASAMRTIYENFWDSKTKSQ